MLCLGNFKWFDLRSLNREVVFNVVGKAGKARS